MNCLGDLRLAFGAGKWTNWLLRWPPSVKPWWCYVLTNVWRLQIGYIYGKEKMSYTKYSITHCFMVGRERFERSTYGLRVRCSTSWANDPDWMNRIYSVAGSTHDRGKTVMPLLLLCRLNLRVLILPHPERNSNGTITWSGPLRDQKLWLDEQEIALPLPTEKYSAAQRK